jgi:hypothetical protein
MNKKIILLIIFLIYPLSFFALTISTLPYGIDIFFPDDAVMKKIKTAGIAWIHMGFDWTITEPQRGKYDFSQADRVINFADKNGISILAKIGFTPGWANKNKGKNYPAKNVADWKNFVQTVVNRYKNRVKYWAIWNEPNLTRFFALGKDKFVQQVLLPAAQTIRATDPAAFIVGPELSHLTNQGSEWYFWMKYILDNAGGYFDIISHHIYEDLGVYYLYELLEEGDNFIPAVKTIIEESGQGHKPFWITETGWDTSKYSETMQADRYLDMLHTRARKNYPQKVFFYQIIDDPRPNVEPFGILRSNGEAKPAYNVYKDYIAGLIPDPGNPDENKINKKCYAEQTVNRGDPAAQGSALQKMRRSRIFLRGYSASASKIVDMYYNAEEEFQKIALADARVFNLGRKLLEQALALLSENGWIDLNQPLPESFCLNARELIGIIKNEYSDSRLAPLALLAEKNLSLIGRAPIHDLLEFYMKEEILKQKRIP